MTIDYIPGTTSNLVGDPAEGGAFSSGNKGELSGANTAAANAATSATAAATSAAAASQLASDLSAAETNAAAYALSAATSAAATSSDRTATQGVLSDVSNIYDQFDDRYLGSKTVEPTVDNDGNALLVGAMYFNSTNNLMKVYNGSSWQLSAIDSNAVAFLTGATFTGDVNIEKSDSAGEALLYVHNTATTGDADAVVRLDSSSNGESVVEFYHDGTKGARFEWFTDGNPDLNIATESGTNGVIDIQPNDTLVGRFTSTGLDVTGGVTVTGDVTAPEFIGIFQGETVFKARAAEALTKGDAVYVSGISGNSPVVSKADANGAATFPAFGLANADTALGNTVDIVTAGQLKNIDTSGFALGDTLYLSTTPGVLTATPPTGEGSVIQNMGKVEREHASVGSILVVGSGRTAATPNLNNGNIFLGNASNKSVSANLGDSAASALSTKTIADLTITSADINGGAIDGTVIGGTTPAVGNFTTVDSTFKITATRADNGINFHAISTDEDENNGPIMDFERISASPADGDNTGIVNFKGRNDAGEAATYAQFFTEIIDASDGSEDGRIEIRTLQNGTLRPGLTLFTNSGQPEVTVNGYSADVDFRVKGVSQGALIFADAFENKVGIKTGTPTADLDVNGTLATGITTISGAGAAATDPTLIVDRTGVTDGAILSLKAGGTANANFFSTGGNRVILCDNTNKGIKFTPSSLHPRTSTNGALNNSIDLGLSSSKFRNVYANGIVFDAVAGNASSNTLGDYEEGTWTPEYKGATTNPVYTQDSHTAGRYTKVGNVVHAVGRIRTDSATNVGSGQLAITLPFSVLDDGAIDKQFGVLTVGEAKGFNANFFPYAGWSSRATSLAYITRRTATNGQTQVLNSNDALSTADNSNDLVFSITYLTD